MLAWLLAGVLGMLLVGLLTRNMINRVREPQFAPAQQSLVESTGPSLTVQGIIYYTNKARQEMGGLPPLSESSLLNTIAIERLKDMFEKQYFAHQSPSGEAVTDVAYRRGYQYKILAENIGLGLQSDEKMVQGWLQSPGHRENILRPECLEIGVAVGRGLMKKKQVWMSVQVFGLQSLPVEQGPIPGSRPFPKTPGFTDQSNGCLQPDAQLSDTIKDLKRQLAEMDEVEKKLKQEMEESSSGLKNYELDRIREKEAVTAYNQKVLQYNALVRDIQLKMEQYSQLVTRYNNQVTSYNTCLGRAAP